MANFELPPELAPYLAGASLIAIQKPAGGVRPVACGDAIRRLTSKLMLKRVLPLVSPKLLPTQLGISVPAATEIIFHRVASQIANSTDDQKTFLVLDLKNAFNCIDRSCIMEAVMKYAPSLARWFLWCYSVPSRLCFGKFQLTSEQGVQQGDPLGSLLFALGIHDCVVNVSLTPGVLWSGWYADDATIQAPLPTLDPLLLSLSAALLKRNIFINPRKTKVICPNVAHIDSFPSLSGFLKVPLSEGFELLGGAFPGVALDNLLEERLNSLPAFVNGLFCYQKLISLIRYFVPALMLPVPTIYCVWCLQDCCASGMLNFPLHCVPPSLKSWNPPSMTSCGYSAFYRTPVVAWG